MRLTIRKFLRYIICLTTRTNYILFKKKNIEKIFEYIKKVINNDNYIINKIEYI